MGQPAYFVGHSLGGFVSLMTAAQTPELARGVLLLDSPLLGAGGPLQCKRPSARGW